MARHKVLSTKKILPSLKKSIEQYNIELVEKEFIVIKPILTTKTKGQIHTYLSREYVNVIFTSANAIDAFLKHLDTESVRRLATWKVFCLSQQTRKALVQHFPEKNILETADDAKSLAAKIIKSGMKEMVFFCGNKRRDELPSALKKNGIKVEEVVVYETLQAPTLVTDDPEAILFFSPSGAESYFSLNRPQKTTICFATGQTTARSIAAYSTNKIIVSELPGQQAMIESLIKYYTNLVT